MTYNVEEKKKRHVEAQNRYTQRKHELMNDKCFQSGCKEPREVKGEKMLRYCAKHTIERREWQRARYQAQLRSEAVTVRVTEKPEVSYDRSGECNQ